MFRSKVIAREDVAANVKLAKAVANIPVDALTDEYGRFCKYLEQKDLLTAAYEINCLLGEPANRSAVDKEELRMAKTDLKRAMSDLVARVKALCDISVGANNDEKALYGKHLSIVCTQCEKENPDYKLLSEAYYALGADVCGIVNSKKVKLMTDSINNVNQIKSVEEQQSRCSVM